MAFQLKVNGQARDVDAVGDTPLLWVLRDNLGLTGTKSGCGIAQCGACTVFLDGKPLRSCSLQFYRGWRRGDNNDRGHFRTRERGGAARVGRARRSAMRVLPVGQIMSAVALLKAIKKPSDGDIDLAMNGNLCRCATYVRIRAAIHDAARTLEG